GTEIGTLTGSDGRFALTEVPVGSYVIRVMMLGHEAGEEAISVTAGAVTRVDFTLGIEAIVLQEIVVTGTIGATPKSKLPFTVSTITTQDLPVPQVDAARAIQGKVPGVIVVSGSGRPGAEPSILLRGPAMLDASGRSQDPLIVVDGVILGSGLVDLDALDIENVEIVKGAAAASLYGSRAANGVIQISTNRGRGIQRNEVNYTFRADYGTSQLEGSFPLLMHHPYAMNAAGDSFIGSGGVPCLFLECELAELAGNAPWRDPADAVDSWNTVATGVWPAPGARDQVDEYFEGGEFIQSYISATGRTNATNFHFSFGWMDNGAIMPGQDGMKRFNFRLNADQGIRENLIVSASAFYSRNEQDRNEGELFDLTRMPAGVDLTACESDPTQSCIDNPEDIILRAEPFNDESENPLYEMLVRDFEEKRNRFLGGASVRWGPLAWLDLDANASYDRLESEEIDYWIKGYRTLDPDQLNEGYLGIEDFKSEAFNASVTATGRFTLTDEIRNRTQFRYLYERDDESFNDAAGYELAVTDVPTLSNLNRGEIDELASWRTSIRADGYFLITNFDMYDKYIVDALVRNDGSSLFGEDERRQWYYRLAGAWRLGEEEWFTLPLDELKLRAAYGTAGGRPRFEAQYETYDVSGGRVSGETLGNVFLKPEYSKETELGIDMLLLDGRMGLTFNYAHIVTDDQILPVPQPAYSGFESQWQNAAQLTSNALELSFDWRVVQTEDFTWSTRVLWDQIKSEITGMNVPNFQYGVTGQALGSVFYARDGEEVGTFYGTLYATGCGDLSEGADCSEFVVDENGWLVWVGAGGDLLDANWGTASGLDVGGRPIMWGTPFQGECTDRVSGERTFLCPVGNSMPSYRWSFGNTFSWKGLTLYALLDAERGFDVYNQPMQWAVFRRNVDIYDQTGVPEDRQKPIAYYDEIYGVSGLEPANTFVEDGSYIKLREVSLRYTVRGDQMANVPGLNVFSGITLSLVGRNLVTWSDYRGYDPEIGRGGGDIGSAAIARVDGYQYPNFRTYTLGIELNF
ncbi:MAG: SusC/RagA family TonB-linked outer membrane protein, partial [Gemmatimonadota bacterium]